MMKYIKSWLSHPITKGLTNIDSPEMTYKRFEVIQSKPLLYRLYCDWYETIKHALPTNVSGHLLEIGSGAGFMKRIIPDLFTSDIFFIPTIDIVLNASHIPFKQHSLKAIIMIDVLHHLSDVITFFKESLYCLNSNGRIIMIEPWISQWSYLIYKYIHHEPLDTQTPRWDFPKGGPLSQANSALPWIIFKRDLDRFRKEFCELRIISIKLHTPFMYLLSGGISYRNMVPESFYPIIKKLENKMNPFMQSWAMFATVILEKI